jgi:hypothetical protein
MTDDGASVATDCLKSQAIAPQNLLTVLSQH